MKINLDTTFLKSSFRPDLEEKRSYTGRLWENYTNGVNVNPTGYAILDFPLQLALVTTTVALPIVLTVGTLLLDVLVGVKNGVSYIFNSLTSRAVEKSNSNLDKVIEFTEDNKEYILATVAAVALATTCYVYRGSIIEGGSYIYNRLFGSNPEVPKVPEGGLILELPFFGKVAVKKIVASVASVAATLTTSFLGGKKFLAYRAASNPVQNPNGTP